MIYSRQQLEEIEDQTLAPYGIRSKNSRGRKHPEEEGAGCFQDHRGKC